MLIKISWRNIFRHPVRSLVLMLAVALGLWAGLVMMAFAFGMVEQMFEMSISKYISHAQIHHPEFSAERDVRYQVPDHQKILEELESDGQVKAFSPRTLQFGFVASAAGSRGVEIRGVDPSREEHLTGFSEQITRGTYFSDKNIQNPVAISERLAGILNVEEGSRLVLTFQDLQGEITSAAFRIEGIYQTADARMDERFIYANIFDIGNLLGEEMVVNEIALLMHEPDEVNHLVERMNQQFPGILIRPWHQVAPQLLWMNEYSKQALYIIIIIVLIGLAFGILNTMQMAVFERLREIGMLKAIGMNKKKIFSMIMFETVFLSMTGGITGIILGALTISGLNRWGLDFSAFADALATYGIGAVVYPSLSSDFYINLFFLVLATAILASIYPAIKAVKINPSNITKN